MTHRETLRGGAHEEMIASDTIRTVADLRTRSVDVSTTGRDLHTLTAGMPSLGTAWVCQKPTPARSDMASSVVSFSTTSRMFALLKSEGAIVIQGASWEGFRVIQAANLCQ